jgi:hypothetical protein
MTLSARPAAVWESLTVDETQNLIINLATDEPRHIAIIPPTVLTVVFGEHDDPTLVGRMNFLAIEKAIGRAWDPDRLRELVGVNHPGHIFQLWLEADDFV